MAHNSHVMDGLSVSAERAQMAMIGHSFKPQIFAPLVACNLCSHTSYLTIVTV